MRVRILSVVVIAAALLGVAGWLWWRPAPRADTPLAHEVYVWQRAWSDELKEALAAHAGDFGRVVVLARQVEWRRSEAGEPVPEVFGVGVDWKTLKMAGKPVGAAIRIAGFLGDFARTAPAIASLAGELVAETGRAGVTLAEIQIDFDCPTSRLEGYRQWLAALQQQAPGVPVHITALPTWLGHEAFAALAQQSGAYVLQVHSLARPAAMGDPVVLCDPAAARAAVETAGRLGVPFRVALPTYGYVLVFDAAGKYLGLEAEGRGASWPAGAQRRWLGANAGQLADLVRAWNINRPKALTGIIWYRLPVEADRLNWRWPTLAAVMAGRAPTGVLAVELRTSAPQVQDVILRNTGDGDLRGPLTITVDAPRDIQSRDALGGFAGVEAAKRQWVLRGLEDPGDRIAPGEQRACGWVRY